MSPRLSARLAALRTAYAGRLRGQLQQVAEALAAARAAPEDRAALFEAQMLVHRIAGSAGAFGFAELGELAGQIDENVRQLRQEPPPGGPADRQARWDLIEGLLAGAWARLRESEVAPATGDP